VASNQNLTSHQRVVFVIDLVVSSRRLEDDGSVIHVELERISILLVREVDVNILFVVDVVLLKMWLRILGKMSWRGYADGS
jgi:hypothetical protein